MYPDDWCHEADLKHALKADKKVNHTEYKCIWRTFTAQMHSRLAKKRQRAFELE